MKEILKENQYISESNTNIKLQITMQQGLLKDNVTFEKTEYEMSSQTC